MPPASAAQLSERARRAIALLSLALVGVPAIAARADNCPPPGLYDPASCAEVQRSGYPWQCWRWARPQVACDYVGYYVGGGSPHRVGHFHHGSEGTWGWDYHGRWFPRRIRLDWFLCPRPQGGEGQYQADGPRILEAVHEARSR